MKMDTQVVRHKLQYSRLSSAILNFSMNAGEIASDAGHHC